MLTPITTLLIGALALWVMTRLARRTGLPEAVGIGASLCILGAAIAFAPTAWRAWLVSGNTGDRALSFARIAGVAGLLFLSGARGNYSQFSKSSKCHLYVSFAAGLLFALAIAMLAVMGQQDHGAILVTAVVVAGASLWLPGELLRGAKGSAVPAEMATSGAPLTLTALAILVVHFYSVLSVIGGRRATIAGFTIVVLYEATKLVVFFSFAYFITTRFVDRAEGRVSTGRMSIAYLLITILFFVLAFLTISQLVALAWAFVAGALWTRSEVGRRFGESSKVSALCLLMSFAFLPALLQTHGRSLTSWKVMALAVILAVAVKFAVIWAAALLQGVRGSGAIRLVAATLTTGEMAVAFLGFAVTRWAIDGPTYFGILAFTFLTLLLGPLVWHFATRREEKATLSNMRRNPRPLQALNKRRPNHGKQSNKSDSTDRSARRMRDAGIAELKDKELFGQQIIEERKRWRPMKTKVQANVRMVAVTLAILIAASAATVFAQKPRVETPRQEVQLGTGMSVITPGLMEIGAKTRLFLLLGDKIQLSVEQQKKLEDLYFRVQMYSFQREADLVVADAEFKRLLTRDAVDLNAIRNKMKEIETIRVEVDMKRIETLLQAVSVLTHQQHSQVILLAKDPAELSKPGAPIF